MRGIAIYTGLRVALLAAVWLLVQVVTPIRGLLAIAIAVVISGVISFIALDRPRDRASAGLAGAFSRINDRIERSRTAEDWDEPLESGQPDAEPEEQAVGEHEQSGPLEYGHEGSTHIASGDGSQRADGEDDRQQGDPGEGQAQSLG